MTNRLRGVDLVVLVDTTCNMKFEIPDLKCCLKKCLNITLEAKLASFVMQISQEYVVDFV